MVTVLYGLRYDWLPDGARFIRMPNRMTMQVETHTVEKELGKACALMTAQLLCEGERIYMIGKTMAAADNYELYLRYTDIGGRDFLSDMPSILYWVQP